MKYRFEYMDPLSGKLPWWPHPHSANTILWRARGLLHRRTVDEIAEMAAEADSLIDAFFDIERDHAVAQITADKRYDLFEDGKDSTSGIRFEAHDEYSINTRDNTSEVEALDEALSNMFNSSNFSASDVREYECMASFAMAKLEEFEKRAVWKYDSNNHKLYRKAERELHPFDYNSATSLLLEAQDAIGRAELRRATERLSQKYEETIGKLKDRENLHAQVRAELLEQERLRRQEESVARNNSRHEQNRQVKTRVLKWFEEAPASFASAEKAAKHFCAKLSDEGIEREQRTVADWIRSYAKQVGIKWRP